MKSLRVAAIATLAMISVLTAIHFPRDVDSVVSENEWLERADYQRFYGSLYAGTASPATFDEPGPVARQIRAFVRDHGLERAHVLEVGAGTGELQDLASDYTGLDISGSARSHFHKPFVEASATQMPFPSEEFDAIWTVNALEHIPKPEQALSEMRRVLKDKGLLFLQAAWQCRPWAASGYHVRPYGDLDVRGKLVKMSIPLRESVAFRALYTFPIRLVRWSASVATGEPTAFRYNRLNPDYEHYWDADSDAVNSMDPYEAILWFTSRGDEVLSFEGLRGPLFVRSGTLVFRINKATKSS